MSRVLTAFLALVVWALAGCQTSLRAPICADGELHFPPGAAGHYHFIVPAASAMYSGAMSQIDETDFVIEEKPGGYALGATKDVVLPIGGKQGRRLSSVVDASQQPGQPEATAHLPLAVCSIGGVYYSQSRNDDGTFGVARLDISAMGLTTTYLLFDPKDLKDHGFAAFFVPKWTGVDEQSRLEFNGSETTRLIVDNRDLTPARRDELLALAKPSVFGSVFSRISTPKPVPLAVKISGVTP